MVEEKKLFVGLSRFAGERFDLIQAGGGNSSVKLANGKMLIKASGQLLSDVNETDAFVEVSLNKIQEILENEQVLHETDKKKREQLAGNLMKETVYSVDHRPSIETFLHALLYKYTLHTHPIVVNMFTCKQNGRDQLQLLFPEALFIPYETPGIDLAIKLNERCVNYLDQWQQLPQIIFLQNHGLIVSADDANEVKRLTNHVVMTIEKHLGVYFDHYRLSNELSQLMYTVDSSPITAYLSEDPYLTQMLQHVRTVFYKPPLCPDTFVFCGYYAVNVTSKQDVAALKEYMDMYQTLPKVVIYKGYLFFVSVNRKKAKETEEVFKAHIMTLASLYGEEQPLDNNELRYLSDWEAEKFRQSV
ncbi:hypothetical protein GT022_15265 [Agaribacter marinus]|uniref:Class II aldolase n=1 Tax=Virgibacillus salarius TaxID=447199 RepID=A0A941DYF7_9BACI|nr:MULTISPECIES: class II aldolase/adducin family protein [Bacillaceae]MBR7797399.1 class II aldolase [Virgibacillus salarius]NAZ10109.1 hypothetical protein [Agaribacter marinus]WBX81419.1 class II aldolase/adducin family protein [Virgibacillus salarius]